MMSELELLDSQTREQVEENSRNTENQAEILVNGLGYEGIHPTTLGTKRGGVIVVLIT